ncbi:MAG: DUF3093 domain-containing protein [Propionibacteriaceae bacterium]
MSSPVPAVSWSGTAARSRKRSPTETPTATTVPDKLRYHERLTVPIAWWVLSGLFALSLLLAFGLYLGPVWGIATAIASFAVMAAIFAAAAVVITVDDTEVHVGRARLELTYLGGSTALDAAETRSRRGPGADARAYLVLRPYISTAVELTLDDPADPVPYWLVSSRRPRALAAALSGAVAR